MDHTLFHTFKIVLSALLRRHEAIADNPPVKIYINKIRNRITFKIKTGYKLELLSPDNHQIIRECKKDVDQDKYGENVPKLQYFEFALVYCNLVKNDYQHTSKVLFILCQTKNLVN